MLTGQVQHLFVVLRAKRRASRQLLSGVTTSVAQEWGRPELGNLPQRINLSSGLGPADEGGNDEAGNSYPDAGNSRSSGEGVAEADSDVGVGDKGDASDEGSDDEGSSSSSASSSGESS